MSEIRTGRCLCGEVKLRARTAGRFLACHCIQCQRWTGGGPLFSIDVSDVEIEGGERVSAYHASEWGERVVCGTCGSTLWWKMQGKPVSSVAVGLLDDQSGLKVTDEIFVDYRPAWLPPFEGALQSTEEQEKAKHAAWVAQQKG